MPYFVLICVCWVLLEASPVDLGKENHITLHVSLSRTRVHLFRLSVCLLPPSVRTLRLTLSTRHHAQYHIQRYFASVGASTACILVLHTVLMKNKHQGNRVAEGL